MDNSYDIILLNILFFTGFLYNMNILHSTKFLKNSPANSCLPNLSPSSSSPGPQGPVRQRLSCNIQGGGICDGENQPMESMAMNLWVALSESIQAVNYCLSPTLKSGYLKVLGRNKERHERGTNSKSKKTL